jgi:hypothetical protein
MDLSKDPFTAGPLARAHWPKIKSGQKHYWPFEKFVAFHFAKETPLSFVKSSKRAVVV